MPRQEWPFVLSRQTFTLLVFLLGQAKKPPKKIKVSRQKAFSLSILGFYLWWISSSSYYCVICNILMGQKRDVTELKFLWLVHKTGNSLKFIMSPVQPFSIIFKTVSSNKFTQLCFVIINYCSIKFPILQTFQFHSGGCQASYQITTERMKMYKDSGWARLAQS